MIAWLSLHLIVSARLQQSRGIEAEMPSSHRERQRALVQALWDRGVRSAYVISKQWRIPHATAKRYLARLRAGQSLDEKPRSGRPRKLTPALRKRLGQIKSLHPKWSARKYAQELSKGARQRVSSSIVQRALRKMGYRWRLRPRRKLTLSHKRARVAFARAHLEDSWGRRWFFDECYFNLYRHSNKYWVGLETDDAMELPKLTEAQEKVSVGVAVAIRHGRKSALAFLPKNWRAADLVHAFDATLLPSMNWLSGLGHQDELVIDNDGRHFSPAWLDYVAQKRLAPVQPWPGNSPDLNVVENVFSRLKPAVEDMEPTDEWSLREAIQRAWAAIPLSMTEALVESMPRRLQTVLDLDGGRTKY